MQSEEAYALHVNYYCEVLVTFKSVHKYKQIFIEQEEFSCREYVENTDRYYHMNINIELNKIFGTLTMLIGTVSRL